MLADTEIIELVADRADAGRLPPLVVDPVMVASSGDRLLPEDAEAAYVRRLLPNALIATPNLREASVLVGGDLTTVADMRTAAAALADNGPAWVVVTGGHLEGDAVDVAHERATGRVVELRGARIDTANVHGTGCSFAAAIAAGLARGDDPEKAIRAAKTTVATAIAGAAGWRLGAGHGPVDHFGWSPTPIDDTDTDTDTEEPPSP
jgi:hydroxymethylpyrimidine/phosphomethylpyrimidine kinase